VSTQARVPASVNQRLIDALYVAEVHHCRQCKGEIHTDIRDEIIFDDCTCVHDNVPGSDHVAWVVDGKGVVVIWEEKTA